MSTITILINRIEKKSKSDKFTKGDQLWKKKKNQTMQVFLEDHQ